MKSTFSLTLQSRSTPHWALRASESKAEKFLHHSHLRYDLFTSYITISLSIAFAVNTIASPTADGNARRLWYVSTIHWLYFLYFHIEREGGPHMPRSRWRENQAEMPLTLYNRLVGARYRQSVSIGSSKRITDSDKSFFKLQVVHFRELWGPVGVLWLVYLSIFIYLFHLFIIKCISLFCAVN